MNLWLKRTRGALGMGLIWAVAWAPVAVVVGTRIIDPTDAMDEMWWMVGALPGFLSGVTFAALLSRVAHRRTLTELSIFRVGAWGGLAGIVIGTLPLLLGDTGGRPWLLQAVATVCSVSILSAASASGSLALAQRAIRRERLGAARSPLGLAQDTDSPHQP